MFIKLVVFDHILSATAIHFPIIEMNQIVRKWSPKCFIIIDETHDIGQVRLEIAEYGCDFYLSNLYKWFLAPRGCSFLYFKNKEWAQKHLQPNFISHGYEMNVSYNFFQR